MLPGDTVPAAGAFAGGWPFTLPTEPMPLSVPPATDLSGNVQANPLTFTFATASGQAPQVVTLSTNKGAQAIENTVVIVTAVTDLPAVDSKEEYLVLHDSTEQKSCLAEGHPIDSILNSQDTADTVEVARDTGLGKMDIVVVFERHMELREEEDDPAKGYF